MNRKVLLLLVLVLVTVQLSSANADEADNIVWSWKYWDQEAAKTLRDELQDSYYDQFGNDE
uniref:Uncharacterized protein n=1 Tax=Ciona intestinalis TaxID=7719 RepID=H2Y232_CIOIN